MSTSQYSAASWSMLSLTRDPPGRSIAGVNLRAKSFRGQMDSRSRLRRTAWPRERQQKADGDQPQSPAEACDRDQVLHRLGEQAEPAQFREDGEDQTERGQGTRHQGEDQRGYGDSSNEEADAYGV